jgi:RNA polymerase sigma factor (sigma-70 family)
MDLDDFIFPVGVTCRPKFTLYSVTGWNRGYLLTAKNAQSLIEGLVATHGDQLRRFLLNRVRNIADVPDLTQEVYLRMLRVPNVESVRSPEAYLFTVAKHVVQQHTLKVAASPSAELENVMGTRGSVQSDPALEFVAEQCLNKLQETLEKLSPKARAVFMLSRRDGLSFDEIAVHLGCSKPMVKKYFMKALLQFRQRLETVE